MKRLAAGARALFALAVLLTVGRYAVGALSLAMAKDELPPGAAVPSSSPPGSAALETSAAPVIALGGTPIRVKLMISAGPDRSDVYVDQARVGKTPYLGETSCRTGEPVVIEVVPAEGEKITTTRTCATGTLRVE